MIIICTYVASKCINFLLAFFFQFNCTFYFIIFFYKESRIYIKAAAELCNEKDTKKKRIMFWHIHLLRSKMDISRHCEDTWLLHICPTFRPIDQLRIYPETSSWTYCACATNIWNNKDTTRYYILRILHLLSRHEMHSIIKNH